MTLPVLRRPAGLDVFRGEPRLSAMIGATWTDVPEFGYAPVLAQWASTDDMPDDDVQRRVLMTPDGACFQVPIDFDPAVFVGDA